MEEGSAEGLLFCAEHTFCYEADARDAGCTVGQFLKDRGYSRQILIRLKRTQNGICLNGRWSRTREKLCAGDHLRILLQEQTDCMGIRPVPLPFEVIYEDEHLMVVNKPADMPVHPSMNNHDNTLANAVAAYALEQGEWYPYRCVNRLDRNTTGLLVLAKHMLSAAVLYRQMRERKIRRVYLALVEGRVEAPGTIDLPIGRRADSAIERMVDLEHGERAVTCYQPLQWGADWTLLQCILKTGRTHQIRVHMSHMGHPLPGDFLYGTKRETPMRQLLHSWKLSFAHPITGEQLEFVCPMPEDMLEYMNRV